MTKEEKAKYNKEYREKNKEQIKERNKEYYEKNKERIKEYREKNKEYYKEYREKNKEQKKQYMKEYNEKNKEQIKERNKEYREKNKEQIKERKKEWREKNKERLKEYSKEYAAKQPAAVYKITNTKTGTIYIGQSTAYRKRWANHKFQLRHNKHETPQLQEDWNKYGKEAFIFEIIEELPCDTEQDVLLEKESEQIKKHLREGKEIYNCLN